MNYVLEYVLADLPHWQSMRLVMTEHHKYYKAKDMTKFIRRLASIYKPWQQEAVMVLNNGETTSLFNWACDDSYPQQPKLFLARS